jgi:hypothetical protein
MMIMTAIFTAAGAGLFSAVVAISRSIKHFAPQLRIRASRLLKTGIIEHHQVLARAQNGGFWWPRPARLLGLAAP